MPEDKPFGDEKDWDGALADWDASLKIEDNTPALVAKPSEPEASSFPVFAPPTPAPVVTEPNPPSVPRSSALPPPFTPAALPRQTIDGDTSGGILIPDIGALEAASNPSMRLPADLDDLVLPSIDITPSLLEMTPPPVEDAEAGRQLTNDGLPELSGIFSADNLGPLDPVTPSPDVIPQSAKARLSKSVAPTFESATDAFLDDLPAELTPALVLELPPSELKFNHAAFVADIRLSDEAPAPVLASGYTRDLAALLGDELAAAQRRPVDEVSSDDLGRLACGAAWAAERLGGAAALRYYDEALGADPSYLPALRGRFRLLEREGASDEARAALELLAEFGGPEAEAYRHLLAVWDRLARRDQPTLWHDDSGAEITQLLQRIERAVLDHQPEALATAAAAVGVQSGTGPLASAFWGLAVAALPAVGGAPASALVSKALAVDPHNGSAQFGAMQVAARRAPAEAITVLETILGCMEASPLKLAVARWAARLLRATGEADRACGLLAGVADALPNLALPLTERMDLGLFRLGDAPLAQALAVFDTAPSAGRAVAAWRFAGVARSDAERLDIVKRGLDARPSAVPMALVAEQIAGSTTDADDRFTALELWGAGDLARRGVAHLRRSDLLRASGRSRESVEALRAAAAALPMDPVFWELSWHLGQARLPRDAADVIDRGATAWEAAMDSEVVPALRARAAELRGASFPLEFVSGLPGHRAEAEAADHPARLARLTVEAADDPRGVALAMQAAAKYSPARAIEASGWLIEAGAQKEALAFILERADDLRTLPVLPALMSRLFPFLPDAAARVLVLEEAAAAVDPERRDQVCLRLGEALEAAGRSGDALIRYRSLAQGPLGADADAAARRVLWSMRDASALSATLHRERDARHAIGDREGALRAQRDRAWVAARLGGDAAAAAIDLSEVVAGESGQAADRLSLFCVYAAQAAMSEASATLADIARRDRANESARLLLSAAWMDDAHGEGGTVKGWLEEASVASGAARPVSLGRWRLERALGALGAPELADNEVAILTAALADRFEDVAADVTRDQDGDARLGAILELRAAAVRVACGDDVRAEQRLRRALWLVPDDVPVLAAIRRMMLVRAAWEEALVALEAEARVLQDRSHIARAWLTAAAVAEHRLNDPARARQMLESLLDRLPDHLGGFSRLLDLTERTGTPAELVQALERRLPYATVSEAEALRLSRADVLADSLGDRAAAKEDLRAVLAGNPQHLAALLRLASLEAADGAYAVAGELYIRHARFEREPEALKACFLRIGDLFTQRLPDPKMATGAYERVLRIDPENRHALEALSELLAKANDFRRALAVTEKLIEITADPGARLPFLLRAAALWDKAGDPRRCGVLLKRAVDESPRSLQATTDLAQFYERHNEFQSRHVLIDGALRLLRDGLMRDPGDQVALRALVDLLRLRQRGNCAAAALQLLAAFCPDPAERAHLLTRSMAPTAGRRLAPLMNRGLDERAWPELLPVGIRNLLRIAGPALRKGLRPDLRRWGVARADRVAPGTGIRAVVDPLALDLGQRGFELYISSAYPNALVVEPAEPPVVIIGAALAAGPPATLRFVGGYCARLIESCFDLLSASPAQGGALVVGLIRQVLKDFRHPEIDDVTAADATARVGRTLGRTTRADIVPFAAEVATSFSIVGLHTAVTEGAARVGLLASGDLAASLGVLLQAEGRSFDADALATSPTGLALMLFALGEDHEELASALESAS